MQYDDNLATGYIMGRDSNNGYGNGMFGGDWAWWIIILLIFGWGGNGFGFGGGNGGFMNGALTRGDLCQDMNFNDLQNGVRNVNDAVNLGFSNLNSTICHQQYDTASLLNSMNISNLQSANALQAQIAQCCCDNRYENAQNTCAILNSMNNNTRDVIASQTAGTQRILDYLCNEKISDLQAKNAQLANTISQQQQSQYIIENLLPVAKPAYLTCSPYASAFGFPYATSGGCGCGASIQ